MAVSMYSVCSARFENNGIRHMWHEGIWNVPYIDIVTCRPIARERIGKEARNNYATNNRIDTFLRNARNTCTQQ
jgi:hypothetical protein